MCWCLCVVLILFGCVVVVGVCMWCCLWLLLFGVVLRVVPVAVCVCGCPLCGSVALRLPAMLYVFVVVV